MRPKTKLSILGVVYRIGGLTLLSYAMLHWMPLPSCLRCCGSTPG